MERRLIYVRDKQELDETDAFLAKDGWIRTGPSITDWGKERCNAVLYERVPRILSLDEALEKALPMGYPTRENREAAVGLEVNAELTPSGAGSPGLNADGTGGDSTGG